MKRFSILLVSIIIITSLTSCNYDPYSGERPFDYGKAKWISSDPSAWFEVNPVDEEYYSPKGEIMVDGEAAQFYLEFVNGTNFVCITVSNDDTTVGGKYLDIWGECEFSKSSLTVTIDKDRDEVFQGSYDQIVFTKQELENWTANDASAPNNKDVEIVIDESYFSQVKCDDNYVYYYCSISLKNNTDNSIEVQLLGDFPEEYSLGIVTERESYAVLCEDQLLSQSLAGVKTIIGIPADSSDIYSVVFVLDRNTEYTGEVLKADRNLPDIKIKK